MISKAKEIRNSYSNYMLAVLYINFLGDFWESEGETSKEIPSDIAGYIFLENDKGEFVRCIEADIPLMMLSEVNRFNKETQVFLTFPLRLPNTNKSIFKDANYIKFVIGGLDLANNEFAYQLPFSAWFLDAPSNIRKIYYEAGIWKKSKGEIAEETSDKIQKLEAEKKQLQNRIEESGQQGISAPSLALFIGMAALFLFLLFLFVAKAIK